MHGSATSQERKRRSSRVSSQLMNRTSSYRRPALALALWTLQLVVPTIGILYVQAKVSRDLPLGPQALAILVTCLLWYGACILSVCLRLSRQWIVVQLPKLLLVTGAVAFALLLAEVLLTLGDAALGMVRCRPHTLSWWAFVPDTPALSPEVVVDSEIGIRFNRAASGPSVNRQGFRDHDDFSQVNPSATVRVLLLGDSFAWGAGAVYDGTDSGFADLLGERLRRDLSARAVLWNAAIPGTGQEQQLLHLKEFFPILKPQVVLLAFYEGNDFTDNLHPIDNRYVFEDRLWTNRYVLSNGACRALSPREAWLKGQKYPYESGPALACLRTVSLVYRRFPKDKQPTFEQGIGVTRKLLREIADYVRQRGAHLFVLVIPVREAVPLPDPVPEHEATLGILRELSVPFLDSRPLLTEADYLTGEDAHWSKSGHRKAAEQLFEPLVRLLESSGNLRRRTP